MAVKRMANARSALQMEGRAWDDCGCLNQKTRKSTMRRGCAGLSAAELRSAILGWETPSSWRRLIGCNGIHLGHPSRRACLILTWLLASDLWKDLLPIGTSLSRSRYRAYPVGCNAIILAIRLGRGVRTWAVDLGLAVAWLSGRVRPAGGRFQ
eukprot:3065940-Rhodomonas_salina.1